MQRLHLVERTQVNQLLKEQAFAQSGWVETETAPQLGRMVGARYVVLGNFQKLGSQILINVKLVNAETATIEAGSLTQVKGEFSQLFGLQEQLAQRLVQKLDLEFTPQTQQAVKADLSGTASTQAHEHYIKARLLREQLGEGNLQAAIALLQQALQTDPGYGRAAAELARVYLDRANGRDIYRSATPQDLALAEQFARQAITAEPDASAGYSILAKVLEAQNKKPEALRAAEAALAREKSTDGILAYIGLKYPLQLENQNGLASQIEQEMKALGARFDDPQILFTLGGLFLNEIHGNPAADTHRSQAFYESARQKNPHNPYYAFTLSAFYLLQNDVAAARQILEPLLEQHPEYISLLISGAEAAARLLPDVGQIDPDQRRLQRYPDYTLAYFHLATFYLQQQKSNPDNLILLLTGAQALQRLLPAETLAWTERATRLAPQSPEPLLQMALLYLQQNKDPLAADRWFQQAQPHLGSSPNANYMAARYLMQRQRNAEASVHLERALATWKSAGVQGDGAQLMQYALSLNTLAQLRRQQNQPEAALRIYQEIADSALPPLQKGLAYQRMAEIYAGQNQPKQAFEAYQQYLQLFPQRLQNTQAKNIYHGYFAQQALAQQPDSPELLNDAGQAYLVQGQLEMALRHLSKAQRLAPENAVINYNLGLVYLALKDHAAAKGAFEKALTIQPSYAKACFNLGLAYAETGDAATARYYWQKALELDPYLDLAREALQKSR